MRFSNPIQRELYYRSQIDYCYWFIDSYNNQCLLHPSKKVTIEDVIYSIKVMIRCKLKINENVEKDRELLKDIRATLKKKLK